MKASSAIRRMNRLGAQRIPFLFIIDFSGTRVQVLPLSIINSRQLLYDVQGVSNVTDQLTSDVPVQLEKFPVDFTTYQTAFEQVQSRAEDWMGCPDHDTASHTAIVLT